MALSTTSHCFLLALFLLFSATNGELSENYYASGCSSLNLTDIMFKEVNRTLASDRRMGASLLRLFFHDCFVQGCDASVLLDDDLVRGIVSEKNAGQNLNSLRGFDVIDRIKKTVEGICPQSVSCADILAVATVEAVVLLGGPRWTVLLGRRDSTNASRSRAESELPSSADKKSLLDAFAKKGFNGSELVALSGGHTVGVAQCQFIPANQTIAKCKVNNQTQTGVVQPVLAALDDTPDKFDNGYYGNLVGGTGLLQSDRALMDGGELEERVRQYGDRLASFANDFRKAMEKMSRLPGVDEGQIRVNCSKVNY
ncbi:hypothetical protein ACP70R_029168 [Stipagrostis hirtigluma subsp. patula]